MNLKKVMELKFNHLSMYVLFTAHTEDHTMSSTMNKCHHTCGQLSKHAVNEVVN